MPSLEEFFEGFGLPEWILAVVTALLIVGIQERVWRFVRGDGKNR